MANWSFQASANFDADQVERTSVFNKIAPKKNWKMPIKAWIDEVDFAECNQAAIWFTGAALTVTRCDLKKKKLLVEAPGYYRTIGA